MVVTRALRLTLVALISGTLFAQTPGARFLHEEPLGEPIFDPAAQQALDAMTGPAPCQAGSALGAFPCRGVDLESYVSLTAMLADTDPPGSTPVPTGSALWGFASKNDGREYALFGTSKGTAVIDVTDAARPVAVGSVAGLPSPWREVKILQFFNPKKVRYDAYAYVVSEAPGSRLQILDLTDLPRSVHLAATSPAFERAHTVYLANVDYATGVANQPDLSPILYVEGSNVAGLLAFDVSQPTDPVLVGGYYSDYAHDVWAGVLRGARAAVCPSGWDPCEIVVNWAGDAIRVFDFSIKSHPIQISRLIYPGLGYAHSGWISRDGNYLFSMDEMDERNTGDNTSIRVIDVHDWANPSVAAVWTGTNKTTDHNGYTIGNKYFFSNYQRGLTILDVTNPLAPLETSFFDTYPATDTADFHGAWAVYPFLPSGDILVSNIDGAGGLYVLKEAAAPSIVPREPVIRAPHRTRGASPPR